ncbi:hypothetical protein HDF26_005220 [Pedobacter cryoconitis]|uniref:hypothetical protein n=1 Tax=Pedobacter cryoconitis TaxID=188932 RepID=UPI0016173B84|nr:hypothetical protein [Pedobacter cryoconitis]MBB6274738.1 hypothetical protein [Pedobacter cryoconitis]
MKELIQALARTGDEIYAKIGRVVAVDLKGMTCDVQPIDGSSKILGVHLQTDSDHGGFLLIPKDKSLVSVIFINKETAVLANSGELTSATFQIEKTKFEMTSEGFLLQKEQETLKKLMLDLLAAIKLMTFTTNMGPTIKLINEAQFTAIENRFKSFLK